MRSYHRTTMLVLLFTICLALPVCALASGEQSGGLKIIYSLKGHELPLRHSARLYILIIPAWLN